VVCAGAKPVAVTNCLNFGNPEKPGVMWQFSQAVDGITKACQAFETPVTGGNVSFYNETEGQSIYPTPVIGMVGIIRNRSPLTPHFKQEQDEVLLVGNPGDELGGSRYASLFGPLFGPCPKLDLDLEKRCHTALLEAFEADLLQSLHDVSDGGLMATVAECCFGSYPNIVGCVLNLQGAGRPDAILFGESQTRYILSCKRESLKRLNEILDKAGVPYQNLGKTGTRNVEFSVNGNPLLRLSVEELYDIWYNSIAGFME
jgi:phosphoribosylformylglycinamidine synthase